MKLSLQGKRLTVSRIEICPDLIEVDAFWPVEAIAATYNGQCQKVYRHSSISIQPSYVRWCRSEDK